MASSAQRKLDRGIAHSAQLLGELRQFKDADAYTFTLAIERPQGDQLDHKTHCRILAEERQRPPEHWPLLAGEAIQALRAALDHAVWASWKSVPANQADGAHTMFPIALDSTQFAQQRQRLRGVPAGVVATVERLQPYAIAPATPRRDALALLHRLANIDKHRTLAALVGAIAPATLGHSNNVREITEWDHGTHRPLGAGCVEVGSFKVTSELPLADDDVTLMYGYEVLLEGLPLGVLWTFVRRIFEALWEIETGQPPGPGAPYPMLFRDGRVIGLT
jgi:hypothetical protein